MAAIEYDKFANNFLNAFNASADRADRHTALADEAKYREFQITQQQQELARTHGRQDTQDAQSTAKYELEIKQLTEQMAQAKQQNQRLEMDYTKKDTLDLTSRFVDGGLVDNNLLKMAVSGSDLKKQLFGDIVDVRDVNVNTDKDLLTSMVNTMNSGKKFRDVKNTPNDTTDDIPWTVEDLVSDKKFKIVVDSNGNPKLKNLDEFLSATGYKNHIDSKTWERQVEILKATKTASNGYTSGTIQELDRAKEAFLVLYPKATKQQIAKFEADFIAKDNVKSFQYKESQATDIATTLVKVAPFSRVATGKPLEADTLVKLQKIEDGNNVSETTRETIRSSVSTLTTLGTGIKQLSIQDADSIGLSYESIKTTVGKYLDLDTASDAEIEAVMNKIASTSTINQAIATYIKSMSGAASSDQERAFLKEVMTGGDYTSKDGRLRALKNFQQNATVGMNQMLDLWYGEAPMTVYKAMQLMAGTKTPKKNKTGKKVVEEPSDYSGDNALLDQLITPETSTQKKYSKYKKVPQL